MKIRLILLTASILAFGTTTLYARDAAYEAALVIVYDGNCAKLPTNFVKAITKEGAGFGMKDAQDGVQDEYKSNPAEFCAIEQSLIKCMLNYSITKKSKVCK
jgi:hypothetical protein